MPSFSFSSLIEIPSNLAFRDFLHKIKLGLKIMRIIVLHDAEEIGKRVSEIFIDALNRNPKTILGLATGSSPLPVYHHLVEAYKQGRVSFRDAKSYNLDEYLHCPDKTQTYRYFMAQNLFNKVDIQKSNTFFPDPNSPESYDKTIALAGGVDLQLLGIGVDGHIGFNEPGTAFDSKTHIVNLAPSTLLANARFFGGDASKVPNQAVTMGLGTILQARHIVLVADTPSKKEAVQKLMSHQKDIAWPASVLNDHANTDVFISEDVLA